MEDKQHIRFAVPTTKKFGRKYTIDLQYPQFRSSSSAHCVACALRSSTTNNQNLIPNTEYLEILNDVTASLINIQFTDEHFQYDVTASSIDSCRTAIATGTKYVYGSKAIEGESRRSKLPLFSLPSANSASSVKDDFGTLHCSELSVPAQDLENLEWLSHFVEESFSEYSVTEKLPPNPTENQSEPEISVPEKPCFTTLVQTKARTKQNEIGR
ncbi:GATA transcription factor 5-like [Olea europaea subsp. europaea]|uniref:GATA transcription factor 5-like n=1 Tax=Olea europaea subsp. europaea TaxID=158383 RepID=A0A8S0V3I2_OLEEU|nr:GATA transcription factor 5-like [Olea europaea subsp. europaea]